MNHRTTVATLGIVVLCLTAPLAAAAKPTDAFKKAVETVWQELEFSKLTGSMGKYRTFGVVLRDDLMAGSVMGATDKGVMDMDYCVVQEVVDGSVRPPLSDKNDANRLIRPVKRGTVFMLFDLGFKDTVVELQFFDGGQLVTRREVKTLTSKEQSEKFCTTLRVAAKPARAALDGADAPGVLGVLEGLVKPFTSEQAAKEFAASLVAKQP